MTGGQLGSKKGDLAEYVKDFKIEVGEERVELYHRCKAMECVKRLHKYQTGQHQRLTMIFQQQLQQVLEYKSEFGDISNEIKRFSHKPSWSSKVCTFKPN